MLAYEKWRKSLKIQIFFREKKMSLKTWEWNFVENKSLEHLNYIYQIGNIELNLQSASTLYMQKNQWFFLSSIFFSENCKCNPLIYPWESKRVGKKLIKLYSAIQTSRSIGNCLKSKDSIVSWKSIWSSIGVGHCESSGSWWRRLWWGSCKGISESGWRILN